MDSPQVANKDSRFRAHHGATSPARGIMLHRCRGAVTAESCSAGEEGGQKTNATDQLCDKNSDVSFPRGRSQAAYESGVRCHARPKTFVEFCNYQASFPWWSRQSMGENATLSGPHSASAVQGKLFSPARTAAIRGSDP